MRSDGLAWCMLVGISLLPRMTFAQSTGGIAGTVRDTSGAVLPGVTVEAASPALIEKVRTVVNDAQGNYKITDLRPGTYTVTFTLTGFAPFKREGVELSAGFTATVNADLKIGSREETVTVTGASPIVYVQNARTQQVIKSELLESLPAGSRNVMSYVSLTLGAANSSAGRNDVGGDKGEQGTGVVLHGAAVQEVVVDTGGNSAETETGGANINMVPKDGGNRFKLFGTANFTNHSFSAKSVPNDLKARGITDQSSVKQIWDYGVGVGGPLKRDRAWFYGTTRWWGAESYGANNYYNKSFVYGPQVLNQATWSYTATNKLLIQAGASFLRQSVRFDGLVTDVNKFTGIGTSVYPDTTHVSILEVLGVPGGEPAGYRYNAVVAGSASYGKDDNSNNYNQRLAVSYITGSHAVKAGLQTLQGNYDFYEMQNATNFVNYTFRGGVPIALTQFAGPFVSQTRLHAQGLFAQDQWTIRRLTVNYGVRYDHFNGHALAQDVPAGPFRPAFHVDRAEESAELQRHHAADRRGVRPVRQRQDGA